MWKKTRWFIPPFIVIILVLAFFIGNIGREKPPTPELENAERSMVEAKQKEADLYVPDIFSKAEEDLKKAKDLVREKKYQEAKKAAEEAASSAREAISQVEPNKSKMKAEIEQAIPEIRKKMSQIKSLVVKSPRQVTPREKDELEKLIQKWEKDIENIETMMQEQKIRQAYDQLMTLKKEVDSRRERVIPSPEEKAGVK